MVTYRPKYGDKVSQMISWGHWFTLFNILLSLALSSRYLFISDWPGTLTGRIYAISSWLGHFSFLAFALYLLIIFPLTFVVMSQRLLRFLSAAIGTAGLTLLLFDIGIYEQFRLHLNPVVWDLVINPVQGEMARRWQFIFIAIPVIFLIEMLFGTWSWQKLRSLNRQKFGKPVAVIFITAFITSHIMYIWADANFYRPVTMQRYNLPVSYPMTARKFLERHGLIDTSSYEQQLLLHGDPTAQGVEYPVNKLSYADNGSGYNLLLITLSYLDQDDISKSMPKLAHFAQESTQFARHYSSEIDPEKAQFGLYYGISGSYYDGILNGRVPSALMSALSAQNYQIGFFSTENFTSPLYRYALLADYSLPPLRDSGEATEKNSSIADVADRWSTWLKQTRPGQPWFALVNLSSPVPLNSDMTDIDDALGILIQDIRARGEWDKTVIIITAGANDDVNELKSTWVTDGKFNRGQLRVPLLIHWPETPAQVISKLTAHPDIMATLMQRLLHVSNPQSEYTQGEDLFSPARRKPWIFTGDNNHLVIIKPDSASVLTSQGKYQRFDENNETIKHAKPDMAELLQVLTEQKRFIDTD
ncbi:MAG: LPS biosynthesis-modulating metalloenzyme YejM [Morganella sp. (in: enterobacteria)]